MNRFSVLIAPTAPSFTMTGAVRADRDNFSETAAASSRYTRQSLVVSSVRHELKASEVAGPALADALAIFSKGETGGDLSAVCDDKISTRDDLAASCDALNIDDTRPINTPIGGSLAIVDQGGTSIEAPLG